MSKILLKDIDELKGHVAVTVGVEVESLQPFLRETSTAVKLIKEVLSEELYNSLLELYDNDDMVEKHENLLPYVASPLYNLAIYDWMSFSTVQMSDAGITTNRDKTAFQWQHREVKEKLLAKAYDDLDALLTYLDANAATDFPDWEASTAYSTSKAYFINSAKVYSEYVNIRNSRRTFVALTPTMKHVERVVVQDLITSDVFTELKASILEDDLTDDQQTLLEYIQPVVAHFTMAAAIEDLDMDITADGALTHSIISTFNNTDERKPASVDRLQQRKAREESKGQVYLKRLKGFMDSNASESLWTSYYESANYTDITVDEDPYPRDSEDDDGPILNML